MPSSSVGKPEVKRWMWASQELKQDETAALLKLINYTAEKERDGPIQEVPDILYFGCWGQCPNQAGVERWSKPHQFPVLNDKE